MAFVNLDNFYRDVDNIFNRCDQGVDVDGILQKP